MGAIFSVVFLVASAPGDSALRRAEEAFQELEFDKAEKLFRQSLEQPATLDERKRAWRGLGLAMAFQGRADDARASFEKMLLIDPEVRIDAALGPKISKPFEAAQAALEGRRNRFELRREPTGAVTLSAAEEVPLASRLELHARVKGPGAFSEVIGPVSRALSMRFSPGDEVEAWAIGTDAQGGVVYLAGSERSPRLLPAPMPAAVASAAEEARREADGVSDDPGDDEDEEGVGNWPLFVGLGAAVGAGIAVGVVATQRPALVLPEADRTGRLP